MKRTLGRDRFWCLSMSLFRVVGALVILLSHIGWGFGSLFVWGDEISSVTSYLT
jgi:hypothetical protein